MKSGKYVFMAMLAAVCSANAQIRPGKLWYDESGHVINAHGGGVMFDRGVYWWYGEHKVYGREGNRSHVGVHVYSSTDLEHWTDRGIALAVKSGAPINAAFMAGKAANPMESDIVDGCVIERPKVVFCPKTGKYVMHFHLELKGRGYDAARVGIATSDHPEGPFEFLSSQRPNGEMSRDMTLFVDVDGSAWQICASESNRTTHVNRLTEDFTGFTGEYYKLGEGESTEAAAICRHGDWYFLIGSGCTGWKPNVARLYRARSIKGPWERLGNPCRGLNPDSGLAADITWGAQSTFLLPVAGRPGEVIAMFDIWNPANHEESRYVWLPVMFEKDRLWIDWKTEWTPQVSPLPTQPAFRFMTFNVYGDYNRKMPARERAKPAAKAIIDRHPGLVSLQEISGGWYESGFFAELAKNGYRLVRGDEFYAFHRAGMMWGDVSFANKRNGRDWCNHEPLLYDARRFALLDSGCEFYHLQLQVEKSVTWGVFEDRENGRRLIAFATHFWWKSTPQESSQHRELNARRVLDIVSRLRGKWGDLPVVGGGDLNCQGDDMALKPFLAYGLLNAGVSADVTDSTPSEHGDIVLGPDGKAHGEKGVIGKKGCWMLDHVFYSANALHAIRHEVVGEQSVLDVSDHSPVIVDLEFRQ